MTADLNHIIEAARVLCDAVRRDECGEMVAGQFVGGNGGLLSRETIKAALALERAIAGVKPRREAGR